MRAAHVAGFLAFCAMTAGVPGCSAGDGQERVFRTLPDVCRLIDVETRDRLTWTAEPTPAGGDRRATCTMGGGPSGRPHLIVSARLEEAGSGGVEKAKEHFLTLRPRECEERSSECRTISGAGDDAYVLFEDVTRQQMTIGLWYRNISVRVLYLGTMLPGRQGTDSAFQDDGTALARSIDAALRARVG